MDRCIGDDIAVNDDSIRICRIEQIFVEAVIIVVDDGKSGTWCIRCGNCRNDDDVLSGIVSSSLCCIDCTSPAYRDDDIDIVFPDDVFHLLDFTVGRDTAEDLISSVII